MHNAIGPTRRLMKGRKCVGNAKPSLPLVCSQPYPLEASAAPCMTRKMAHCCLANLCVAKMTQPAKTLLSMKPSSVRAKHTISSTKSMTAIRLMISACDLNPPCITKANTTTHSGTADKWCTAMETGKSLSALPLHWMSSDTNWRTASRNLKQGWSTAINRAR